MLHSKLKCNYYGFFNLHFGHISSQSLEFDTFNINNFKFVFVKNTCTMRNQSAIIETYKRLAITNYPLCKVIEIIRWLEVATLSFRATKAYNRIDSCQFFWSWTSKVK
jgi:hypothetical protein